MANVEVSDTALKEIRKVIKDQKIENSVLRVGVEGGGCSGFQYKLAFEEESQIDENNDVVIKEEEDLKVVVDRKSLLYMDGTVIDFHEDISKRGFVFNNPHATKGCGCGSSFSV
jgi:iron-sulfur cluster assembly protein